MSTSFSRYAQSMPFGAELQEPEKHLQALLDEAREDQALSGQRAHEWVMDMVFRDAAIARCALVLAHRELKRDPALTEGSTAFIQIEGALEHIFRA